jgi:hypothetical protein
MDVDYWAVTLCPLESVFVLPDKVPNVLLEKRGRFTSYDLVVLIVSTAHLPYLVDHFGGTSHTHLIPATSINMLRSLRAATTKRAMTCAFCSKGPKRQSHRSM